MMFPPLSPEQTIEKTVRVTGSVFSDVHPLLYARDLTEPGAEKTYPVFDERSLSRSIGKLEGATGPFGI